MYNSLYVNIESNYQDAKGDRKEVKNLFPALENTSDKKFIREITGEKYDTLESSTKLCDSSKIKLHSIS